MFDPLDGSSNIEAGLPVGTIFGIYRRPELSLTPNPQPLEAIMQPGSKLLASGACARPHDGRSMDDVVALLLASVCVCLCGGVNGRDHSSSMQ